MKFYILNALVPPRGVGGLLVSPPFSWGVEIQELLYATKSHSPELDVISAVSHQATAEFLGVPVSRKEVFPEAGDVALVARLKKRATTPGDVEVTEKDLEFRTVLYGFPYCDCSLCFLNQGYHPDSLLRFLR